MSTHNSDRRVAWRAVPACWFLAACSVLCRAQPCEVLYVAKGHANAVNDGSSWNNAFWQDGALADALTAASVRLAEPNPPDCIDIWMASGVYKPPASGSYALRDRVNIYGGFCVGDDFSMRRYGCIGGENAGRPCEIDDDCPSGDCDTDRVAVISGDINDDDGGDCTGDDDCGEGNLCVAGTCRIGLTRYGLFRYENDGSVTVDGLVFRSSGNAVVITSNPGICPQVGPTLRNCLFHHNYATQGGALKEQSSATLIENCVFRHNEAEREGGALHSVDSTPTIINSRFESNRVRYFGGAVYLEHRVAGHPCPGGPDPLIDISVFSSNVRWGSPYIRRKSGHRAIDVCR